MNGASWSSWMAAAEGGDRDDDPGPHPITRITCRCGRILSDPPGATAEEVVEDGCRECAAAQEAHEAECRDAYSEAMREQAEAEAGRLRGRCQWCGREAPDSPCPECAAGLGQAGPDYSGDEIPW